MHELFRDPGGGWPLGGHAERLANTRQPPPIELPEVVPPATHRLGRSQSVFDPRGAQRLVRRHLDRRSGEIHVRSAQTPRIARGTNLPQMRDVRSGQAGDHDVEAGVDVLRRELAAAHDLLEHDRSDGHADQRFEAEVGDVGTDLAALERPLDDRRGTPVRARCRCVRGGRPSPGRGSAASMIEGMMLADVARQIGRASRRRRTIRDRRAATRCRGCRRCSNIALTASTINDVRSGQWR